MSIDFNLKIVIKSKFGTLSIKLAINCVGVKTFERSEWKLTNVRMLKFHIRLCPNAQQVPTTNEARGGERERTSKDVNDL